MKEIKKMNKKELIQEFQLAYQQMYDIGCFGVKDLIWYKTLEDEIYRRGYEIHESVVVK
jgi:hypothetical protein